MTETTVLDNVYSGTTDLSDRAARAAQADATAKLNKFATYRLKKATNTIKRQDAELARFAAYVNSEPTMGTDPRQWEGITFGLVDSFIKQLLMDGYALGTIGCHLATIKRYARLAHGAGVLTRAAYAEIKLVEGTTKKEAKNVNENRVAMDVPTRRPTAKKEHARVLKQSELDALAEQCDDSPQGRRDALILMLLGGLGLRVGEACLLRRESWDGDARTLTVERPKTTTVTRFRLGNGRLRALLAYLEVYDGSAGDQLLHGTTRWGRLVGGMSERAVRLRVKTMAERAGIIGLAPHDFRHSLATAMAPDTKLLDLMAWFGWKSPTTATHYVAMTSVVVAD